jgi:hypothetical protein
MVKHLRDSFPKQTSSLSDEDLHTMVVSGIEKSLAYKIILEDDIQRFLECMNIYGGNFDKDPEMTWARDILKRGDVSGTQKMDAIYFHSIIAPGGD